MRASRAVLPALLPLTLLVLGQPELRGPLPLFEWDAGDVTADGVGIPVQIYAPASGGPYPVVAVVHGFLRRGSFMAEMGRTFATHGYVAVVPDMPCGAGGCDHDANGRQLSALLDWAEAQGSDPSSMIFGKVDGARRGVVGHSWGGLGVFVASSMDPRMDVVVTLDPNDDRGQAAGLAGTIGIPNAHLMAETPGNCNATDWANTVAPMVGGPKLKLRVAGSGHCDVEDPSDSLCPFACGDGDRSTSYLFRRYAVAFVSCVLHGDAAWGDWIGGASFASDVSAGAIDLTDTVALETLPCRGGPALDGGVSPAPDAAAGADAATPAADAASPALDGGAPPPADAGRPPAGDAGTGGGPADASTLGSEEGESGCGCQSTPAAGAVGGWILLALGLRARRRSSP